MNRFASTMNDALRLIRGGKLGSATDAILNKLRQLAGNEETPEAKQSKNFGATERSEVFPDYQVRTRPPAVGGTFSDASYTSAAGSRRYKVFLPAGIYGSPLPLVVMLHGCTQSPDDFALGTGMNELAADRQCVVVYPEQTSSANAMKCWNWFKASDQHRDYGEPAIIAGITREVVSTYGLDANRVYIAGLSAGGAMAVVMGRTYPDLYAAVGVHSGIPYAAAHDAPSAFAAMKGATSRSSHGNAIPQLIPTIVLHGDRDKTVHPSNGKKLAAQFSSVDGSAELGPKPQPEVSEDHAEQDGGGHTFTRTLLRNKAGKVVVEYWLVHGAGHAWFGGNPLGSHTDPEGPDASKEVLRFFLEHDLAPKQH